MIQALQPALVLLDVQIPVVNGLEIAGRLRGMSSAVRVIIVTAHDTPQLRSACRAAGVHGFVPKTRLGRELPAVLRQAVHDWHVEAWC
ncbi:MAG: response regulator transcription factor [Acidobacteria bacterium]|nr:response regulator transcription factor [Acidobacteriota bacterium]